MHRDSSSSLLSSATTALPSDDTLPLQREMILPASNEAAVRSKTSDNVVADVVCDLESYQCRPNGLSTKSMLLQAGQRNSGKIMMQGISDGEMAASTLQRQSNSQTHRLQSNQNDNSETNRLVCMMPEDLQDFRKMYENICEVAEHFGMALSRQQTATADPTQQRLNGASENVKNSEEKSTERGDTLSNASRARTVQWFLDEDLSSDTASDVTSLHGSHSGQLKDKHYHRSQNRLTTKHDEQTNSVRWSSSKDHGGIRREKKQKCRC